MNIFDLQATISLNGDAFMSGVQQAQTAFGGLGSTVSAGAVALGNLASGAITKAADGIVDFGKAALNTGMSFDSSMANVAAISGATGEEIDALRDKAKEMGATTKFTATEAADAFSYMAMAGWDAGQMMDGISGIMNLAAASGEDLATTSDIVTDALTAFGLKAEDSGHFADVLAAASSNANTNVGLMGETFKYAAPVAGALGFSIEDTAQAIGLMANAGIKGSQAGTALRSILSRLAKPTKESQTAMNMLGLTVDNADGSMKSFAEIMDDIRRGFEGNLKISTEEYTQKVAELNAQFDEKKISKSDYQAALELLDTRLNGSSESVQAMAAAMLGGQEAMSGLLAIVNSSAEDYAKLSDAIEGASGSMGDLGAAAEMAETQLDNLPGSITLMQSAFDGFKTAIYEKFSGPLREMADAAAGIFSDLADAVDVGGISGAFEQLGGILENHLNPLFANLSEKIPDLSEKFPALTEAINDFSAAFNGEVSSSDIDSFAGSIGFMLSKFEENKPDIINSIKGAFGEFMDGLKGEGTEKLLSGTAEKIAKLFEKFTDDLPETIDRIRGSIHEFFGAFNGSNEKQTGSIAESLGRIAGAFFDIGEVALDQLTPQVSEFIEIFSGAKKAEEVETIGGAIAAIINKVLETSTETVADVSEGFAEFFGIVAKQGLDKQMAPVVNEVVRLIDEFTDSAHVAIDNITDSMFSFLDGMVEKSHITPALSGLNQALAKLLGHFSVNIPPQINDVKTSIDNFFGSLGGWVIDTFVTPVVNGLQKFIEILEKLASAADTAKSKIREFFDFKDKLPDLQLMNTDTGESFGLGDVAKKAASAIGQGIKDGVQKAADGMWDFLTSDLDTQIDEVKGLLGMHSPSRVFAGIGENMVLGLERGWGAEFGGLESQVDRDMRALNNTARIGFEDSAIGRSSAAGISSMFAANETGGRGDPIEINLVLDGDVAATALYDPLRRTAFQKGQNREAAYA